MARIKSAYREKSASNIPVEEIAKPNIPKVEIDNVKADPVVAASIEVEPSDAVVAAIETATKADDAALALKRQVEALRQSEEMQRQQAAQLAAQRPMSREDKIKLWRSQGLSDREAEFLRSHDQMVDFPQIASLAANEALAAGIERDTPEYWSAVETNFEENMKRLQAQAAAQPTPEFFRAPPPKPPTAASGPASFVSAPVSREVPTEVPRELRPGQINLSAAEVEHARVAGVDIKTYAKHKIELDRQKRAGLRQNG